MLKQIRSYVLREGRMTVRQKRALQDLWSSYGLDWQQQPIDLQQLFQRDAETVLEIGFGMGQSLLLMAEQSPELNFIGIEVHKPGAGALIADASDKNLNNLRVSTHNAVEVLDESIADNSLSRVQLYFPDPWHKKRHHKRRIVQPEFVKLVTNKLKSGGIFHLVTDWQHYAEHMVDVLTQNQDLTNLNEAGIYSLQPDYRPTTKYEQRAQRLQHDIFELLYKKN